MSDLEHLTDAEREALEDEDLELDPGESNETDVGEEGEKDSSQDADEASDAGEDQDDESSDDLNGEATEESAQSFNVPTGDLGEIEASIAQLQTARDELESAYESGDSELTYAEHRAKLREIDGALLDLNAERAEVKAIQKMNAAYQQEWWNREIKSFKREALRADGVDYDKDAKLEAEWDKAVRYLGNDPDNADKDAGWFLKEAHEIVKARFRLGRTEAAPSAQQNNRRSAVDEALAARRAKAGEAPKTLSRLPEAGMESEGSGEFSHLDNLSGLDLEKALSRMSADQQDRYLSS